MSKDAGLSSHQKLQELEAEALEASKDPEFCLTMGEALLRVNKVDEAAGSYLRAIELDPRSDLRALYWEWLGLVREMEGRLEEALEAYFHWQDADPIAIEPVERLGTLLVVLGRWTDLGLLQAQFERRAEHSSELGAAESLALFSFVVEHSMPTESPRCRSLTMDALERDPDSPTLRFLLGLLSFSEQSFEQSQAEFERVLELDPAGLWQEPRFALDWNGSKARVMLAKMARQQGDLDRALDLLVGTENLAASDSEGLIEVAELLLENHHYDELAQLTDLHRDRGPRFARLQAECLLGRGEVKHAQNNYQDELRQSPWERVEIPNGGDLSPRLRSLWSVFKDNLDYSKDLVELCDTHSKETLEAHAPVSALQLHHRYEKGMVSPKGLLDDLQNLTRKFPQQPEAWEMASILYQSIGQSEMAQLCQLQLSKLTHFRSDLCCLPGESLSASQILLAQSTPGGSILLKLETDHGTDKSDQIFGWARSLVEPAFRLAKGVLEILAENHRDDNQLSFLPRSFRVMVTPLSPVTQDFMEELSANTELSSIPLGFLATLLSLVRESPPRRIFVSGRLGLRGDISAADSLEQSLLLAQDCGQDWDELYLAEPGCHRLLRIPAALWHGRPLKLLKKAEDLLSI